MTGGVCVVSVDFVCLVMQSSAGLFNVWLTGGP